MRLTVSESELLSKRLRGSGPLCHSEYHFLDTLEKILER